MGTATRTRCPGCDAGWDHRNARFCGRCGAVLAGDPPDVATSSWTRPAAVGGAVAVVVAVVAGTVGLWAVPDHPPPGGDMIALPEGDVGPQPSPLSPDERSAVLAPFEVSELRCEPEGCERWRRELPVRPGEVAGGHGLVVATVEDDLHAFDAATGEVRWAARFRGPAPDGTYSVAFDAPIALHVGEELVVLTGRPAWLQVRDVADGALRWSRRTEILPHAVRTVGDEVVVVLEDMAGDGRDRVTAFDARDGSPRWSVWTDGVDSISDEGVVAARAGSRQVLDPATGDVRFEVEGRPVPHGPWFAVHRADRTRLLATTDGVELAVVDGTLQPPIEVDGTFVALLTGERSGDAGPASGAAVVGLRADGTVRWRHDLEPGAGTRCCELLVAWPQGTVLVHPTRHDRAVVLDVTTGAVRDELPSPPRADGGHRIGDGSWVVSRTGSHVVVGPNGVVTVRGRFPRVVHAEPLVVAEREVLSGLRLSGPGLTDGAAPDQG